MNVWFVRSTAEPIHTDPVTNKANYVPGEDHLPKKVIYRAKCLRDGFARIGWPNTGPMRPGFASQRLAPDGESFESIEKDDHRAYLMQFASIVTGDLILMPIGNRQEEMFHVHVGVVVRHNLRVWEHETTEPGLSAYYYFHDIPDEPYECAHRVDVLWGKNPDGSFGIHHIRGMNWRKALHHVNDEVKAAAIEVARTMGLLLAI